jgi:alpha-tubulin suppressor-like RCC1 family protein
VTAIAAGANHSLALTRAGQVLAWGFNTSGELGDGSTLGIRPTPAVARLPHGTQVRSLAAGCDQSLALTAAGQVLAWGENKFGQLGTGSSAVSRGTPAAVHLPRGADVTAISAGCTHDLARLRVGGTESRTARGRHPGRPQQAPCRGADTPRPGGHLRRGRPGRGQQLRDHPQAGIVTDQAVTSAG